MKKLWAPKVDEAILDEALDHSNRIEREYSEDAFYDAKQAWNFLIEKPLTIKNILLSHKRLLRRLWPEYAGRFRDCDVLIGGHRKIFISESLLKDELQQWLSSYETNDIFNRHCLCISNCPCVDEKSEAIIKLHVEFERIHPFADGNGRIGRIILNYMRVRAGLPLLVIHEGAEQMKYYEIFS